MRAFTDTPVSRDRLIASLEAHRAADRIVQGRYWRNGRGCAVGCSLVDFGADPGRHQEYERLFGIPCVLARLEDGIFERLPAPAAREWPLRFTRAIRPGADLSCVWPQFAVWLLVDNRHGVARFADGAARRSIENVADLYSRSLAGETIDGSQWRAARRGADAAVSAAFYAVYAAADVAAYAAAYAAADAAGAQADRLVELLMAA